MRIGPHGLLEYGLLEYRSAGVQKQRVTPRTSRKCRLKVVCSLLRLVLVSENVIGAGNDMVAHPRITWCGQLTDGQSYVLLRSKVTVPVHRAHASIDGRLVFDLTRSELNGIAG